MCTSSDHDLNTGFKGIGIKLKEKLHTQGIFYLREDGRMNGRTEWRILCNLAVFQKAGDD